MKKLLNYLPPLFGLAGVFLLSAGCIGSLAGVFRDEAPPKRVVCTAHYTPVLPNVAVGADSCGNRWLWQDGKCWYYVPDEGIVVEINCPSEGDTTYSE